MKCTADAIPEIATQTDRSLRVSPLLWLYLPIGAAILLLALAQLAPDFYRDWMVSERSVLESVHVLVPAAAFFIAGEEMSWGQHLLN